MLSQEVIKYSFKVKNKIKTTVSILKDKINGLKSMIMIKIYSLFDFESFELLDIFDDFEMTSIMRLRSPNLMMKCLTTYLKMRILKKSTIEF